MAPALGDEGQDDDAPPTPGAVGAPVLVGGGTGFDGTYVDGELPADGAVVANFTRQGVVVFARVEVENYSKLQAYVEEGRVEAVGAQAKVEVVDALAGYLEVEMEPGLAVEWVPAAGVSFEPGEKGTVDVRKDGADGLLFAACGDATFELVGGRARMEAGDAFCEVFFRAQTDADVLDFLDLDDAYAEGTLGAEVSVTGNGAQASVSSISYRPVDVALTINGSRVSVAVSGTSPAGQSVFVVLPRSAIDALQPLEATYDGQPAARAASAADALNASDDGGVPEFFVSSDGNVTALVVSVPHFSVHIFEIAAVASRALPPGGVPLGEAALPLALGAVVAAAAAAALWRKPEGEL